MSIYPVLTLYPRSQWWLARWRRWSCLILQPLRRFTYVTAHSPTIPSLHLRHSFFSTFSSLHLRQGSFLNSSVILQPLIASPTSHLILQTFRRFTYVTVHFFNLSVASSTLQLILQPFRLFTLATHTLLTSPGEPPMFFIQPHMCTSDVKWCPRMSFFNSPTLPSLYLSHRHFTYVTWRAAHVLYSATHVYFRCKMMSTNVFLQFSNSSVTLP